MAEISTAKQDADEKARVDKACKAYGIDPKYLVAWRVDKEDIILVTRGGKKVRYTPGGKVEPLDQIAVTGINPAAKKRKVIAGKPKK